MRCDTLLYASKWDDIILILFDGQEWAYIPCNEIPIIYRGSSQFKLKSHPSRYCLHLYSLYGRNMTAEQILLITSRNLGILMWKQNAATAYHDVYKQCVILLFKPSACSITVSNNTCYCNLSFLLLMFITSVR